MIPSHHQIDELSTLPLSSNHQNASISGIEVASFLSLTQLEIHLPSNQCALPSSSIYLTISELVLV